MERCKKIFNRRSRGSRLGLARWAGRAAEAACLLLLFYAGNAAASLWHDRALQRELALGMTAASAPARNAESAGAAPATALLAPGQTVSVPGWGRPAFSQALSAREREFPAQTPAQPAPAKDVPAGFAQALAEYPDLRAWFSWPGILETAVAQCSDNEYYLGHTLDGAESRAGTPFFDFRSTAAPAAPAALVYGHNMKSGEAFGLLGQYQSADAARAAPLLTATFSSGRYEYRLFAAFAEDVGLQDYWDYPAAAAADRAAFLQQARQRALYWLETPPEAAPVLGLSTCTSAGVNGRLVLLFYQTGRADRE